MNPSSPAHPPGSYDASRRFSCPPGCFHDHGSANAGNNPIFWGSRAGNAECGSGHIQGQLSSRLQTIRSHKIYSFKPCPETIIPT